MGQMMVNQVEFLDEVRKYIRTLEEIHGRFKRAQNGSPYLEMDVEAQFHQMARELSDLCRDHLTGNAYGLQIAETVRHGTGGWPERISLSGVQELISLARSIETRVQRTPTLVKAHEIPPASYWDLIHSKVQELAKSRMASGHYADAVEACFKELNNRVKAKHKLATGKELDGVALMRQAFKLDAPTIILTPLVDDSAKSTQHGYLDLFAGSMAAIRNPKAHDNVSITEERAVHFFYLASLLLFHLEEAV